MLRSRKLIHRIIAFYVVLRIKLIYKKRYAFSSTSSIVVRVKSFVLSRKILQNMYDIWNEIPNEIRLDICYVLLEMS